MAIWRYAAVAQDQSAASPDRALVDIRADCLSVLFREFRREIWCVIQVGKNGVMEAWFEGSPCSRRGSFALLKWIAGGKSPL